MTRNAPVPSQPALHPEMYCAYCKEKGYVTITRYRDVVTKLDKGGNLAAVWHQIGKRA